MKGRDILIGLIFLVILISAALLVKKSLNKKDVVIPVQTPSVEEKFEKNFPGLTIPDDIERTELKDVSGGDGFGIATKTEILANLPDVVAGKVYKAWLENSEGKTVLLGNLRIAKGGYLIEYNSKNYSGYNKIIVTLDNTHILEGSF